MVLKTCFDEDRRALAIGVRVLAFGIRDPTRGSQFQFARSEAWTPVRRIVGRCEPWAVRPRMGAVASCCGNTRPLTRLGSRRECGWYLTRRLTGLCCRVVGGGVSRLACPAADALRALRTAGQAGSGTHADNGAMLLVGDQALLPRHCVEEENDDEEEEDDDDFLGRQSKKPAGTHPRAHELVG